MMQEFLEWKGDPEGLRDAWESLYSEEKNTAFQDFAFCTAYIRHCPKDCMPHIITVQQDSRTVGIMPLQIRKRRILGRNMRVLEFLASGFADYCEFLHSSTIDFQAFLEYASGCLDFDLVHFGQLREGSATLAEVSRGCGKNYITARAALCRSLVFSREENIAQMLNKRDLRRKANHLGRMGKLSFERCRSHKEADPLLEAFFRFHTQRWKGTATPSVFEEEKSRAFVGSLIAGQVMQLSVLCLDRQPVSFHLDFARDKRVIAYMTAFDPSLQRYSPGLVSLRQNILAYLNEGKEEYDLSRGAEAYKERFTNTVTHNHEVLAARSKLVFLRVLAMRRARRLARAVFGSGLG